MIWRVPLFDTCFGPEEEKAVLRPLRAGWLTMGEEVSRLEEELCSVTGAGYAIAVSSCTAALQLACAALGVGPGDEVVCPTLTFVATANAPVTLGAGIRLAESIGPDDLTVDPASMRSAINSRTKAIILVHYAGFACHMPELLELAEAHSIPVIEDCAHALFTTWRGKVLGLHGRVGCFSFFSNKNATCGEGGALLTNDARLAERLTLLRSHGMTTLTLDRHSGRAYSYDVLLPGYNYRLDEMRAALLRAQLRRLPAFLDARRTRFARYISNFRDTPVHMPFTSPGHQSEYANTGVHLLPVLLPAGTDREIVMGQLKDAGIQTSIHYPPVHSFTAYRQGASELARTESLARRQLTLPFYPGLSDDDVDLVSAELLKALEFRRSRTQAQSLGASAL